MMPQEMAMKTIDVHDLKHNPDDWLNRIRAGEQFVIICDGQAIAEVHPLPQPLTENRPYGLAEGMFVVPDDFDDPLPEEILREFGV